MRQGGEGRGVSEGGRGKAGREGGGEGACLRGVLSLRGHPLACSTGKPRRGPPCPLASGPQADEGETLGGEGGEGREA